MDFELSDEQKMVQETVRKFGEKVIAPCVEEMDLHEKFNETIWEKSKELCLSGAGVSFEYGGTLSDYMGFGLINMELARADAGVGSVFAAHALLCANNIARNATGEQKQKYLPRLSSGELRGCMGLTEPGAGSDAVSLRTRARREGDYYYLTGAKTFITNAPDAHIALIYATLDPTLGAAGLCAFIVESDSPGYKAGKKLSKMGLRSSPTGEIIMEDCKVPAENLIGGVEGKGLKCMFSGLDIERLLWSCGAIGIAEAAFAYALKYAKEREQFGQPIFTFQLIQEKLVTMSVEIECAKLLAFKGLSCWDGGKFKEARLLAAQSKLYSSEMVTRVTADAVQVLGGYGFMKEYPVERYMRDSKVFPIGAGTSEVQKIIIANSL